MWTKQGATSCWPPGRLLPTLYAGFCLRCHLRSGLTAFVVFLVIWNTIPKWWVTSEVLQNHMASDSDNAWPARRRHWLRHGWVPENGKEQRALLHFLSVNTDTCHSITQRPASTALLGCVLRGTQTPCEQKLCRQWGSLHRANREGLARPSCSMLCGTCAHTGAHEMPPSCVELRGSDLLCNRLQVGESIPREPVNTHLNLCMCIC
jgi:hypothetical protein